MPQIGRLPDRGLKILPAQGGPPIADLQGRGCSALLDGDCMDALTPRASMAKLPVRSAIVDQTFLWAFIAGLAWCPFWFGSNVLLAWGINAALFPGLVVIYELSLLLRGERHPVAMKQVMVPAALFGAVVLWILIQNATWTPAWLHHPIWQMAAEALDKPIDGSISVNRDLTTLALLRLITAASVFWLALQLCRDGWRANLLLWSVARHRLCLRCLRSFRLCIDAGARSLVCKPFPTQ